MPLPSFFTCPVHILSLPPYINNKSSWRREKNIVVKTSKELYLDQGDKQIKINTATGISFNFNLFS